MDGYKTVKTTYSPKIPSQEDNWENFVIVWESKVSRIKCNLSSSTISQTFLKSYFPKCNKLTILWITLHVERSNETRCNMLPPKWLSQAVLKIILFCLEIDIVIPGQLETWYNFQSIFYYDLLLDHWSLIPSFHGKIMKHSLVSLFFFCQKIFFSCETHNRFIWEPSSLCVYALIHKGRLNYSPHTLQYIYMDAEKLIQVWSTFKEEYTIKKVMINT